MSWASIRGHEQLVRAFSRVVERGRLAHAYLFVGPAGVGKERFAVELAKTLLCEQPGAASAFDACDRCPACLQIAAGTHPDFQTVGVPEDKHEFPIALVQEVIRNLAMKPARGRNRVAILRDADQLNEESANAFLKTLEEPPPASLLVLLGTNADRQLPTTLSRCQIIRFPLLVEETVAEQLLAEDLLKDRDEARRLVRLSGGNAGQARALTDPAVSRFRREFLDGLTQPQIDSVGLARRLVEFVEDAGKDSAPRRQRAALVLQFTIDLLRAALSLQLGREQLPHLDAADTHAAQTLAKRIDTEQILKVLDRCFEADYQVDRRLQLLLVLEAFVDALGQQLQASQGR